MYLGEGSAIPANTDVFRIDLDNPVTVSGYFWIAGLVQTIGPDPGAEFPAPYDTTIETYARSWLVANDPVVDVLNIGNNSAVAPADNWDPGVFPHGVWTLRPIVGEATCDPCDMNCDGEVNAFDIEPFLDLLFGPNPQPCDTCTGDVNGDGSIDAFDIEPFLNCLFP